MNKLIIKQNTITENVTYNIIHKLYNNAKAIKDYEELNQVAQSQVELQGNLQVNKAYEDEVTWLTTKFPNLQINVTGGMYIRFADPVIDNYWKNSVYGDGIGIMTTQALSITNMPQNVFNNTTVTSFNELVQFGITSIPHNCFSGATNLTSINTSKITDFGDNCFKDSGITSIDLSSCNYYVSESAFRGCASLQSVIWPEQSFKMQKNVFYGCTSLQSVDLTYLNNSNANYAIRQSCFSGCTSLTSVIIGTNVKAIDDWAFSNCQSLSSINLSGIETISSSFGGCSSLTSIDLSSCITIGSDAFSGCTSLQTVKLGSNLTTIGSNAFKNCSALTTIQVPSAKLSDYQTSFPDIASMMIGY